MTKHLYTYINPTSRAHLDLICQCFNTGGIVAYPTDVNWAFACDPRSSKAVSRLKKLKPDHPKDQPFTLLCNSMNMISQVAHIDSAAYRILKSILPGSYTVLFASHKGLPRLIRDRRQTVGVRWPESPLLKELIDLLGYPLLTTSLPQHKEKHLEYGYEIFDVYAHRIELVLDLGEKVIPKETTILSFLTGKCELIRLGEADTSFLR